MVAVSEPFCEAKALFWNAVELVGQVLDGGVTVIAEVPLWPSLVAVMVAEPATTPLTRPLAFTVAIEVLPLLHDKTRPVKGLPLASLGVAVSSPAWPASTVADAGLTLTEATGTVQPATVTYAVSDRFPGLLVAASLNAPQLECWKCP